MTNLKCLLGLNFSVHWEVNKTLFWHTLGDSCKKELYTLGDSCKKELYTHTHTHSSK